jgi:hypothetical protein
MLKTAACRLQTADLVKFMPFQLLHYLIPYLDSGWMEYLALSLCVFAGSE